SHGLCRASIGWDRGARHVAGRDARRARSVFLGVDCRLVLFRESRRARRFVRVAVERRHRRGTHDQASRSRRDRCGDVLFAAKADGALTAMSDGRLKFPLRSKLPATGTTIFTVMSALAVKHGAVNLGQGFPDYAIDPALIELVAAAMRAGHNQYPLMPGVMKLREAIAAKVVRLYGRAYDPVHEVTVTTGATQAIYTAIQALAHAGDEVIVFEPAYDSYI